MKKEEIGLVLEKIDKRLYLVTDGTVVRIYMKGVGLIYKYNNIMEISCKRTLKIDMMLLFDSLKNGDKHGI